MHPSLCPKRQASPPHPHSAKHSVPTQVLTGPAPAPTSFCKCTCFSNSTIIPLGGLPAPAPSPPHGHHTSPASLLHLRSSDEEVAISDSTSPADDDNDGSSSGDESSSKKQSGGNCNECNRQFCLDYNLPICKNAREQDVFTTCFQRDSRKDEAVVFIFIFATAGLLVYAVARPWVERWMQVSLGFCPISRASVLTEPQAAEERRSYIPVPNAGDE